MPKISIHASRGGSDEAGGVGVAESMISIHASRGGSDKAAYSSMILTNDFNPRFPRGKRRAPFSLIYRCR